MWKYLMIPAILAGCVEVDGSGDDCGAAEYQSLIGSNLAVVSLPAALNDRVIRPGMAVTTDFQSDRLNIVVDDEGYIADLYCG